MANPNYFKLRDYLQSLIDMTIEAENKNPIYYYFPIDSRDLAKNMELIKNGYNKDILPCLLYTSPSPRDMRRSRMPSSA